MLHKKLGEKIAETGYFAESGPGTLVEGPPNFCAICTKNDSALSGAESLYNYSNWCILEFRWAVGNT
jgi:hypothetical protein